MSVLHEWSNWLALTDEGTRNDIADFLLEQRGAGITKYEDISLRLAAETMRGNIAPSVASTVLQFLHMGLAVSTLANAAQGSVQQGSTVLDRLSAKKADLGAITARAAPIIEHPSTDAIKEASDVLESHLEPYEGKKATRKKLNIVRRR